MEIIKKWFENGTDYASGVALYGSLPKHNRNLLNNFKRKENVYNSQKLKYELRKLLPIQPIPKKEAIAQKPVLFSKPKLLEKPSKKDKLFFHQLPESLQPVLLQAHSLFKENCFLKVKLNSLSAESIDKALQIQLRINHNFETNALCWKKIDYWLEYRQLPKESTSKFSTYTPVQLLRTQQLLYVSISKLNTRLQINRSHLSSELIVKEKIKLLKAVAKQESNLIQKNEELQLITRLIDNK